MEPDPGPPESPSTNQNPQQQQQQQHRLLPTNGNMDAGGAVPRCWLVVVTGSMVFV